MSNCICVAEDIGEGAGGMYPWIPTICKNVYVESRPDPVASFDKHVTCRPTIFAKIEA